MTTVERQAADRVALPATGRLIDLSMPIEPTPFDPAVMRKELWRHEHGGRRIGRKAAFNRRLPLRLRLARAARYVAGGRRIGPGCFPDGLFLGNEVLTLSVHAGSHVDAPFHYGPLTGDRPALRVDQIPLERCVGAGVLLRLTHRLTGEGPAQGITAADVREELARIGHTLSPGEVVLVHTGADRLWPGPRYFTAHPGMTVEATEYLLDQGISVIGVDTAGFDLPAPVMIERYYRSGDAAHLWPCHLLGRRREFLQIERLGGLDRLPRPTGFTVMFLPIHVSGAGAAWTRPVAIVPEEDT
ncbi:cyclase family protein [Nonomuraea sp. AD125B]|uniref:cyclase family protein n=1 Tax=Nonomuraea TaxID=83681 RepID=UPI0031D7CE22